jgi:murein L,D-transpeptidase YcbB/YkuD
MPGVRIDRLLASTAAILLIAGTASIASAEPKFGTAAETATAPAATSAPSGEINHSAKPAEPSSQAPAAAPAAKPQAKGDQSADRTVVAIVKPEDIKDASPVSASEPAEEKTEQPAAAPAEAAPAEQPAATVSPDQPAEPAGAEANPAEPAPATAAAPAEPATTGTNPAPTGTETPATQPVTATGGDEVPAVSTPAPADNAAAPTDNAAAPAATAPVVADANTPIATQLRELANGKFDRFVGSKKDRPAFDAYYAAHGYAPIWITDGKFNARAAAAIAYLGQVDADGLDPADYPVPNISASVTDPAALAEAEMRLSASVVTYAHHASVGRVHWSRVSSSILYEVKPPAPADVLTAVADANDVAATLAGYEPQAPNYLALKAKLADLRAGKTTPGKAPIANGPVPKLGGQDDRVSQLRERFGLNGDGTIYDKPLAEAVKKFQQEHELKVSGLLTQQTIDALNGRSPDRPIDTILANLERWRWMPHDLGKDYVIVNLPDFTLRVFHDGQQVWKTRIVTGKPTMATPIMTAEMKYITVNPTWNVPPSIVAREYLPALAQDPTVLGRMGLRVSYNPDGSIHISQPPGDHNALGRIRFNFPNKFLVYQHDTPDKNLFALDKRAFSHGCMRVQDPVKYAEVLLSIVRPGDGYSEERIHKMIASRGEQDIQFPHYLPVHLTYQTAFVDEDGRLEFREDMYGRDQVLTAILRGEERKIAESPVDRREGYSGRAAAATPGYYQSGYYQGGYQNNGGNFFSRLFGGGFGDPQPAQRRRAAQGRQSWGFQ